MAMAIVCGMYEAALLEILDLRAYRGGVEQPWRLVVVERMHHAVLQGILLEP
jgi:hypothetical protein